MSVGEEFIEAVRNIKTGKLFIVIDVLSNRYRLLNPEGTFNSLPMELFDEEPILLEGDKIESSLTSSQLQAYRTYVAEEESKADLAAKARDEVKARKQVEAEKPTRVASRSPRTKKPSLNDMKTGVGASWSSSTLVFYKPQIDRLGAKQSFKVVVSNVGNFVITKSEFQSVFSDVVLSPEYKRDGFFSYREIPSKAMKFIKE